MIYLILNCLSICALILLLLCVCNYIQQQLTLYTTHASLESRIQFDFYRDTKYYFMCVMQFIHVYLYLHILFIKTFFLVLIYIKKNCFFYCFIIELYFYLAKVQNNIIDNAMTTRLHTVVVANSGASTRAHRLLSFIVIVLLLFVPMTPCVCGCTYVTRYGLF